jgi:hypothetical protein
VGERFVCACERIAGLHERERIHPPFGERSDGASDVAAT